MGETQGPGEIYLDRKFKQPVRLVVSISGEERTPPQANLLLNGAGRSGRNLIERLSKDHFQWRLGRSSVTSKKVFSYLEYVEVKDIGPEDHLRIEVVDWTHADCSLFLPLWANLPSQARADRIIQSNLLNPQRFWKPYGIPLCPSSRELEGTPINQVSILWNDLIAQGLLHYGYQQQAVTLSERLMKAVILNLKKHKSFFHSYEAATGEGVGERNALHGLAPLSLFLKILGVGLISPTKVRLERFNPYPWPVTIKYRGLKILRQAEETKVSFPGGQTAVVRSSKAQVLAL